MISSYTLRDGLGSGWHWEWGGTRPQWTQRAAIWQLYKDLGIRHIRVGVRTQGDPNYTTQNDWLASMAADGAKLNVLLGWWHPIDDAVLRQNILQVDEIAARFASATATIEAVNEPDLQNIHPDTVRQHVRRTAHRVRSDRRLDHVLYLGPSYVRAGSAAALGDQSPVIDALNAHLYSGNKVQLGSWVDIYGYGQQGPYAPGAPLYVTEFGVQYGTPENAAWNTITERQGAILLTKQTLTQLRKGVKRQFIYDFFESGDQMGLVREDLTPRPAYNSLKKLLAQCDSVVPVSTPPELPFTLRTTSGAPVPADVQTLVLYNGDGSYLFAMWREAPLGVQNVDLKLSFPGKSSKVSYDLIDLSPDCPASFPTGYEFDMALADNPVLLRV